jgi:hypothetical protein
VKRFSGFGKAQQPRYGMENLQSPICHKDKPRKMRK